MWYTGDTSHWSVICAISKLCVYVSSMEGGELFSRIQARGDQAFTEKGEDWWRMNGVWKYHRMLDMQKVPLLKERYREEIVEITKDESTKRVQNNEFVSSLSSVSALVL